MSQKKSNRPISLKITREFNNNNNEFKSKGKIANIIDFHLIGKNRYLKINQPEKNDKIVKSQRTNQFESQDEEDYERKKKALEYRNNTNGGYEIKHHDDELDEGAKIDEKKVDKTFKMIENLLKDKKIKKNDSLAHHFLRGKVTSQNSKNHSTSQKPKFELGREEKKQKFFKDKNIRVNISTNDSSEIIKKPKKINVTNKVRLMNQENLTKNEDIYKNNEFKEDELTLAKDGTSYLNILLNDVGKIIHDTKNVNQSKKNVEELVDKETNLGQSNSLGLAMEGAKGINLAILKGKNESNEDQLQKNSNQILYKANYEDLESLISILKEENYDVNDLKIAKLNRLKVLMELSMKMVGRKYKEISEGEKTILETEANRFQTSYPLPEEDNDNNRTLKIVNNEDSNAKIEINSKHIIDPSEFLSIYTNKLVTNAQNTSGLEFDNVTVTIPAAYGTKQREAIKNSVNQATERDDVQILTRPVAAAVVLTNQRNELNSEITSSNLKNESNKNNFPDCYKLVFDITASSLDASVIRILDSKDFQVISNVGDSWFGLDDVNQRILEYILEEKVSKDKILGKKYNNIGESINKNNETIHEYANLIENIKKVVMSNDVVKIDLNSLNKKLELTNKDHQTSKKGLNSNNELSISKKMISKVLCKDIYDWFLVHIEKSISQAYISDKNLDEIIIIGNKSKIPGFYEFLKEVFPGKKISFVDDEDLAIGAALVGKKSKYQQIKITEVLCKSIGIGLYTGVITYLLFRNSSLPCIGGCVYSTLINDQETMVLDVYEGERPHIKYCRYLGEVNILGLPKGKAGSVKCELLIKMNHEGLLEVNARDLKSGLKLETIIDANPDQVDNDDVNNDTDLDPVEAERYKKEDYDLVYELESLDDYLDELSENYSSHQYSKLILDKIVETKEWLFKNRRIVSNDQCQNIRNAIENFLKKI